MGSKNLPQNKIIIKKNRLKISNQIKLWQNFGSRKIWVQRSWVQKMSPNEFGVKIIGLKKLFGQKKLDQKKCESKTFLGPTDLSLNFG